MLSWILTTYLGRRTIYVWGSLINVCFLIALGVAGSVGKSTAASLAQASLGLIVSVGFTLGPAPASWVIIAETSAIRLRPLTTGIGRAAYYVVNIPCIFLATYMLNPTVWLFRSPCKTAAVTKTKFADTQNDNRAWTLAESVATSGAQLVSSASSCHTSSYRR